MAYLNFNYPKGKSEQFIHKKLGFALFFGSILHSFPYKWSFKNQSVELISSGRVYFYFLNCLVDIIHRTLRSLVFLWCLYQNTLTIDQIVFGFVLFLTVWATYVLQMNTILKYRTLQKWTNALMKLGMKLEEITHERDVYKDPLEKLGYLPFLFMYPQGLVALIGFMIFPNSLTMFHPLIDINNSIQFWMFALVESFSVVNAWSVSLFYILFYLWVHSFGICWTKLIIRRLENLVKMKSVNLEKELHVYRTILVANQGFNYDYYGRFVVPTVYTSTLFIIVLSIVTVLRFALIMQFTLIILISQIGIILIVFNGLSFHLNAWVYVYAKTFIQTGRSAYSSSTLTGKEFRALRPTRVMAGSFFIEMSTVFAYFSNVIGHTINVLLMT